MRGIFSLKTAEDLFQKLKHDFEQMKRDPADQYAAFNFFVTAEHMLDWLYPGYENKDKRKKLRDSEVLLQVCSHIANGAKHFKVQAKHHESVANAKRTDYFGGAMPHRWFPKGYFPEWLFIELTGAAADQFGETIRVNDLADRIVEFWNSYLAAH